MKVTHGTDHSLMQALMEMKEQCEAIMRTQWRKPTVWKTKDSRREEMLFTALGSFL